MESRKHLSRVTAGKVIRTSFVLGLLAGGACEHVEANAAGRQADTAYGCTLGVSGRNTVNSQEIACLRSKQYGDPLSEATIDGFEEIEDIKRFADQKWDESEIIDFIDVAKIALAGGLVFSAIGLAVNRRLPQTDQGMPPAQPQ